MKPYRLVYFCCGLLLAWALVLNACPVRADDGYGYSETSVSDSQLQGQGQGQQQDVNQTFEGTSTFLVPGGIRYPMGPNYFAPPAANPGPNFIPAKKLHLLGNSWRVVVQKNIAESKRAEIVNFVDLRLRKEGEEIVMYDRIKTYTSMPKGKMEKLGFGSVAAKSKKVTSMDMLAEAILAAHEVGGNGVVLLSEGIRDELQTFGWGIGLTWTSANVSRSQETGSVGVGGTGISGGSAGYTKLPWIQFMAVLVHDD
jgi:hypothetical protein